MARAEIEVPRLIVRMRGGGTQRRRLLAELKDLFGPAFGPGVEAYGRSFAERISEDDEFGAQVRERFERGRVEGKLSGLEELLTGMGDIEREEFFQTGWVDVVLPECASLRNPWDHPPWDGNLEAYREDLYSGMTFGVPDLRAFAREWVEELARVGYYGMQESLGLPLKQQAGNLSSVPKPLPLYGEAYPVRVGDPGRVYWLQLDAGRSELGYLEIAVSDEPLRSDRAIFASMTSLEGRYLSPEKLRRILPVIMPSYGKSFWDRWTTILADKDAPAELVKDLEDIRHHGALDYVLAVLRYHRPGFDDLPLQERADLTAATCSHVNNYLEALRKLMAFVEYGTPGRRIPPTATILINRDIKAAVLKDVEGLTYREIGRKLGIPPPEDIAHKGDHPTVRKMVRRARKVLEDGLGEEGWHGQVRIMASEAERWLSRSETEKEAEIEAATLNISYEDALQRINEDRPNTGKDEPGIA